MTDTPSIVKPSSLMPYIAVAAILMATGVSLILGILYLRPQADVLAVIGAIGGLASLLFGLAANFMKAQETHLTVNSATTEARQEIQARAHAEGMLKGAQEEQARIAQQLLTSVATASTPTVTAAASNPATGNVPAAEVARQPKEPKP